VVDNIRGDLVAIARRTALSAAAAVVLQAHADTPPVEFPHAFAEGVRYATVERGNIKEEIFTSRAAIDAVKQNGIVPPGTAITLVDYRDGRLFRYVVMEKRTAGWRYQPFNADRSVNVHDSPDRCAACHQSQAHQDFVFTLDRMKSAR